MKARKNEKHGMGDTKIYHVWSEMKQRIYNPKNKRYAYYGGKGITMDKEWTKSFVAFYKDMGASYELHQNTHTGRQTTIERTKTNKGYNKDNCVWATYAEQMNNTTYTIKKKFQGKTQSISDWAREYGLTVNTLFSRYNQGWAFKRALTTPQRNVNIKTNKNK